MAQFIWQGNGAGTKSDVDDGRNWINEAGAAYLQARYPGSEAGIADEVLFINALGVGAASPAAYDGSSDEPLQSLVVGPAYNGDIGSAGSPVWFCVDQASICATAAGTLVLKLGAFSMGVIDEPANVIITDGSDIALDGYMSECRIMKGNVAIAATATIQAFYVQYLTAIATDAVATIAEGATLGGTGGIVEQMGGVVTCYVSDSAAFDIRQSAGMWTQYGDVRQLLMFGSSTFNWIEGNITTAILCGAATFSGASGADPRYVGNLTTSPACTVDLDNNLNNIRVLNNVRYLGGAFSPSLNSDWLLGGYREAIATLVHTGNSGSNPSSSTAWLLISPYDNIEITIMGTGGTYSVDVEAAADDSGTGATDIGSSLGDPRDDGTYGATATLSESAIWGHQMPAGKPYLGVTVNHTEVTDSTVSVLITRRRF